MNRQGLLKIVVIIAILIFFMVMLYINFFGKYIKFTFLGTYSGEDIKLSNNVQLINSEKDFLFNELKLSQYNIDLKESTVVLSNGEILRIELIKKYKHIPIYSDFIKVYLDYLDAHDIYIYITNNKHVYFDERCNNNYFIKTNN